MQAIGESLREAFLGDGMIGLLQDAAKTSEILISLFTTLLTELEQIIKSEGFQVLDPGVATSLQSLKLCSHCFLALLHPQTGYHGSTAGHVGSVRSYKGKDSMLQTANKLITKPFWQEKHDEMLKKAGSSKVAEPIYTEAFNGLDKLTSTSSPQDVSGALGFAVQKLPELRTALRAGATNALESTMLEVAKSSLKEILESDGSSQPPRLIQAVKLALQLVGNPADVKALDEWAAEYAHAQAWKGVSDEAAALALSTADDVDFNVLAKAMSQCPTKEKMPPNLVDDLDRALPIMMRHLKLKAFQQSQGRLSTL